MLAARRTTRFITAFAIAGLMMGSSPLAPSPLSASAQTSRITLAQLCAAAESALAFLAAHPSTLNNYLYSQLLKWYNNRCI